MAGLREIAIDFTVNNARWVGINLSIDAQIIK